MDIAAPPETNRLVRVRRAARKVTGVARRAGTKRRVSTLATLVLAQAVNVGCGFLACAMLSRALGPEGFGRYGYAAAIAGYLVAIASCGYEGTLVRDLVRDNAGRSTRLAASVVHRAGVLSLALACVALFSVFAPSLSLGVLLLVLGRSARALDFKAAFDSEGQSGRHALAVAAQNCVFLLGVYLLVRFGDGGVGLAAVGLALLLAVGVNFAIQLGVNPLPWRVPAREEVVERFRGQLSVGGKLWLAALTGPLLHSLTQIVLKNTDGDAALGRYFASWQFVVVAMMWLEQIGRMSRPAIARRLAPDRRDRSTARRVCVMYVVGLAAAAAVPAAPMLLAPELLVQSVFGADMAGGGNATRLLGVYLLIYAVGNACSQTLVALDEPNSVAAFSILSGAASVVLCAWLVPAYGATGAACCVILAHGLGITGYAVSLWRRVNSMPSGQTAGGAADDRHGT